MDKITMRYDQTQIIVRHKIFSWKSFWLHSVSDQPWLCCIYWIHHPPSPYALAQCFAFARRHSHIQDRRHRAHKVLCWQTEPWLSTHPSSLLSLCKRNGDKLARNKEDITSETITQQTLLIKSFRQLKRSNTIREMHRKESPAIKIYR